MRKIHFKRNTIFQLLNVVKFALVLLLFLMFISFNSKIAMQQADIKKVTESTNNVVKGQDDILRAIKGVTEDTRVTAQQQTAIIICMLQVPIAQRTTDLQTQCRDSVITTDVDGNNTSGTTGTGSGSASSANPTPTPAPAQSGNSQSATTPTPSPAPEAPQPSFLDRLLNPITTPITNLLNGL